MWLADYEGLLREGEDAEDDMIRGACPIQVAFPCFIPAILRGHNQSILDLIDEPQRSAELLMHLGHIFARFFQESWRRLPLFHGGYFDAQYQLWAPGPIIRMQEDATAVFSPKLYRTLVQPVDRMIARQFECNFIHLHSTSMLMLDAFLEIDELRGFEINIEPFNIPVEGMIQYYRMVQDANRPLLIRGSLTLDEARLIMDSLDPRGLYLHILPESREQVDALRPILGM